MTGQRHANVNVTEQSGPSDPEDESDEYYSDCSSDSDSEDESDSESEGPPPAHMHTIDIETVDEDESDDEATVSSDKLDDALPLFPGDAEGEEFSPDTMHKSCHDQTPLKDVPVDSEIDPKEDRPPQIRG